MRYLILTYYRKPNGKIDESMAVSKNIKPRDIQTANVILDFKNLQVVKCTVDGVTAEKNWDRIVTYYNQFYENIIERLFRENGYEVIKDQPQPTSEPSV